MAFIIGHGVGASNPITPHANSAEFVRGVSRRLAKVLARSVIPSEVEWDLGCERS